MFANRGFFAAFILVFAALLAGCMSPDTAQRALAGAGYTKVVLTGYRFLGCGDGDLNRTGFEAVGPSGQHVTGVVCSGVFKGATIRLD